MLWKIDGQLLPTDFIGDLVPERVLYEYEGPRSFIARDSYGSLLFAHQCGEDEEYWRYSVVPFSENLLDQLETGRIDLRNALDQPRLWIVDVDMNGDVARSYVSSLRAVPDDCLPRPGVTIYSSTAPLLALRLTGDGMRLGDASASVLGHAVDVGKNVIHRLVDQAIPEEARRQRKSFIQRLWDVPATVLAGSVQVLFHRPLVDIPYEREVYDRIQQLLSLGLQAAQEAVDDENVLGEIPHHPEISRSLKKRRRQFGDLTKTEQRVVLEAAKSLAPSGAGNEVEVSGWFSDSANPVVLTQKTRSAVDKKLKEMRTEIGFVTVTGRVMRINFEHKSLVVDSIPRPTSCRFKDEHEFLVRVSVKENFPIIVTGKMNANRTVLIASEIKEVPAPIN